MKKLLTASILTIVLQTSAYAQSSSAVTAPAAAANETGGPAAATSTATAPKKSLINIKYVGVYEGPNFTSDGNNMHGEDTSVSNRPTLQANLADNINAGLQTRINTAFTKDGVKAANETWRLYGTFKNVASYGILSLDLIPRIMLPTSKSNHNKTMTLSPELITAININPKDSRFSFDYSPQMLGYIYSDNNVATAANAKSFILLHNIEGTYQLGASSQLTFGWYPEYNVGKTTKFTNDSNEVDVGVNFDVAKGWAINPYIGIEPVGLGKDGASALKSMEAALVVSGTFL